MFDKMKEGFALSASNDGTLVGLGEGDGVALTFDDLVVNGDVHFVEHLLVDGHPSRDLDTGHLSADMQIEKADLLFVRVVFEVRGVAAEGL